LQKIVVSVTNDLCTDQRVHKICTTLLEEGFEILLIGRKLKASGPLNRAYPTHRMRLFFNKGFLFYAEYNLRLFLKLGVTKKDILVANDLDTLLPNFLIAKLFQKKLVYDSHELFTEVPELINRPKTQKIWLAIENYILPKINNAYTVCDSIAEFYEKKYKTPFDVIKNCPAKTIEPLGAFEFNHKNKKIILYQGALNLGRGLELMIETMNYINNSIFVIIGSGDIEKELKDKVEALNLGNKINFLGKLTPDKLKTLTPLADLGISIEEDLGLNYRFALPNKIFDYMQANVPLIVADLPEMKKIILEHNIGLVVKERSPKKLAQQVLEALDNSERYDLWKSNLIETSKNYSWDIEQEKLLKIFKKLK
jgi:glycosyltransferase involved in cell wall biosynthesis